MSAATLIEVSIVLMRYAVGDMEHRLDPIVEQAGIRVVFVDEKQALLARDAHRRYGKGRHRAALSFGDCFSYALAKAAGDTLLFKGNDFVHTDITPA